MTMLPDFSPMDRKRLKALGVVPEQIAQLRYACPIVRMHVTPPAARNDIASLLGDVERLANDLLLKSGAIAGGVSDAHASAHSLIEQGYWQNLPDDNGPTSFLCLGARLEALRDAARVGINYLPSTPSRHRSANPMPVRVIDQALRLGWTKSHGSNVFHVRYEGEQEIKDYPDGPQRKPYPREFRPSAADGSAFRAIVGVCYEAMGGNRDPLAAIKAYMQAERRLRAQARAAIEAAIIVTSNKQKLRTSRKK